MGMKQDMAAIYCRLSVEDREKEGAESESIRNQRILLLEYAARQGWTVYDIYTDEDFTNSIGTCSFNRTGGRNNYKYSLNALTLNIPNDVTTVYFACTYNGYTYYTSMSVTELKDAQNNSGKVLQIDHIK